MDSSSSFLDDVHEAHDTAATGASLEDSNSVHCVISNDFGQAFTYELVGKKAMYLGRGDLHSDRYDDKEVVVDFSALHTHPNYTTTPGHALYKMVRSAASA